MDFGHLEKMGRELKCPICLSLLKSAVSLTCNHVFCNSCIVESMRSICNCPVCKVPFQRREVRAALHMDNLVSIYKSMEFASGLNILATQVSPPKNSEKPLQAAYDKEAQAPEGVLLPQESSRGKRTSKGMRKKMAKADLTTSILGPQTRPPFSSNKRIHVTPYPVSETPIPPKRTSKLEASTNNGMDKIESENNTKLVCMRPEELTLQPFFWLKEVNEEDEGLEQETTQEMTSLTTPTNAPCFSDIKDSDDHNTPKKMTLTLTSKYTAQEAFDSEMFEWTQRACSPELFSTPLKKQELLHSTVNDVLRNYKSDQLPIRCAFCHSSNDSEVSGEIMHYCDGKSVPTDYQGEVNVIHSHKNCTEWAPDVYFKDDYVVNLSTELARSRRISCSCCGSKGAALGCFEKSCRRSFHYPCAKQTPECRWDIENFVMLCPLHSSSKLPSEMSEVEKLNRKISASKGKVSPPSQLKAADDKSGMWAWPAGLPCKWLLCSSGLSDAEKEILSEFVRLTGITISKAWSSAVTHVITTTEENGACKRTLKILMGILDGKWILSIEWIKACMKSKKPVDEEKYEITVDVHGIQNGPRLGRMRAINKEPKLFSGFWFYLFGEFLPSYKGFLQDLITAATGKVLQRRPISREFAEMLNGSSGTTFIVYSLKLPENSDNQDAKLMEHRKAEAIALAEECRAMAVADSWILDSIAASSLQVLPM